MQFIKTPIGEPTHIADAGSESVGSQDSDSSSEELEIEEPLVKAEVDEPKSPEPIARVTRGATAAQNKSKPKAGKFSRAHEKLSLVLAQIDEDSMCYLYIEARDTEHRAETEWPYKVVKVKPAE